MDTVRIFCLLANEKATQKSLSISRGKLPSLSDLYTTVAVKLTWEIPISPSASRCRTAKRKCWRAMPIHRLPSSI